jgi:hypothetical protein
MTMPAEQALAIIGEKGLSLSSDDMREIEGLITQIPLDDLPDQSGMIYEALSLVVNDPLYEGDVPPVE